MKLSDHIATSLSIEPDDFDYAPFLVAPICPLKPRQSWKPGEGGSQRGGGLCNRSAELSAIASATAKASAKVEAHQLFGEHFPKLLNELNEVLAA